MSREVDALIAWANDIEGRLWTRLDDLKDDLRSDDLDVREPAEAKAEELLSWLFPPFTEEGIAEMKTERIKHFDEMLRQQGFPETARQKMVKQLTLSVRERGRPRERGPEAVRALALFIRGNKTWREIALEISGTCGERKCPSYCPACEDVQRSIEPGRPEKLNGTRRRCRKCGFPIRTAAQKQQVCFRCVDQVRKLADQARALFRQEGIWVPDELDTPGEN